MELSFLTWTCFASRRIQEAGPISWRESQGGDLSWRHDWLGEDHRQIRAALGRRHNEMNHFEHLKVKQYATVVLI